MHFTHTKLFHQVTREEGARQTEVSWMTSRMMLLACRQKERLRKVSISALIKVSPIISYQSVMKVSQDSESPDPKLATSCRHYNRFAHWPLFLLLVLFEDGGSDGYSQEPLLQVEEAKNHHAPNLVEPTQYLGLASLSYHFSLTIPGLGYCSFRDWQGLVHVIKLFLSTLYL